MIDPSFPITNYKIVSAVRNEMASRLDIESLQEVLASHWKPYLENLHVCMTDATCYESHMRFPTDMKLLFEGRKVTRINRLRKLEAMEADGTFDVLPKKEVIGLRLEMEKLTKYLGGIKDMKKLPGALFIVDPRKENIAVLEARKLNIPIVATVDTNCDPDVIDHVIPANDDAIRAVKLLTAKMADAVLEGRQGMQMEEAAAAEEVAAEDAE